MRKDNDLCKHAHCRKEWEVRYLGKELCEEHFKKAAKAGEWEK